MAACSQLCFSSPLLDLARSGHMTDAEMSQEITSEATWRKYVLCLRTVVSKMM